MVEGGVSREFRRTSRKRRPGWPQPAANASEPAQDPLALKTSGQRVPYPRMGMDATSTMSGLLRQCRVSHRIFSRCDNGGFPSKQLTPAAANAVVEVRICRFRQRLSLQKELSRLQGIEPTKPCFPLEQKDRIYLCGLLKKLMQAGTADTSRRFPSCSSGGNHGQQPASF